MSRANGSSPKPGRRFPVRFGLRTVIVLMTLVGIILGQMVRYTRWDGKTRADIQARKTRLQANLDTLPSALGDLIVDPQAASSMKSASRSSGSLESGGESVGVVAVLLGKAAFDNTSHYDLSLTLSDGQDIEPRAVQRAVKHCLNKLDGLEIRPNEVVGPGDSCRMVRNLPGVTLLIDVNATSERPQLRINVLLLEHHEFHFW